jgi:serine/threonine protein kinase
MIIIIVIIIIILVVISIITIIIIIIIVLGSNEIDQVARIHKVLGAPTPEIIQKFRSKGSSEISLDFPPQKGMGIPQLIPHASPDCIDLIVKLLKYDASERISAREAMRHPYFRDVKEPDRRPSQVESTAETGREGDPLSIGDDSSTVGLAGHKAQANSSKTVQQVQLHPSLHKALPNILGKGATVGVGQVRIRVRLSRCKC